MEAIILETSILITQKLGMHGNELVGRELILLLARHLCLGYNAQDEGVVHLVKNTRIFLIPLLNPDGAELAVEGSCTSQIGQNNADNVDLALDFPGKLSFLFFVTVLFFFNKITLRFTITRRIICVISIELIESSNNKVYCIIIIKKIYELKMSNFYSLILSFFTLLRIDPLILILICIL